MSGRKPSSESRSAEIRQRLLEWKQTPEWQRISLRELAVELGTSHQLLSVYLKGLNNWQERDYERRAEAIRNLAKAENRYLTPWEESQAKALEGAAFRCMVESLLASALKRYSTELREWEQKSSLTLLCLAYHIRELCVERDGKLREDVRIAHPAPSPWLHWHEEDRNFRRAAWIAVGAAVGVAVVRRHTHSLSGCVSALSLEPRLVL